MARVTDIGVAHLQKDCASRTPIRPIATSNSMVLATPTAAMLDPNGAGNYHVCADELNVRSVPAEQDGVITWLGVGASVTVYDVSEGWGRISKESNGAAQWVNMKYLCP